MPNQKQQDWKEELNKIIHEFYRNTDEWNLIPGQCRNPYTWVVKKLEDFIQSLLSKALTEAEGEADICNEEMFYDENGIDKENGAKFYSNGYNAHRSHVSEVKKKYLN